MINAFGPGLAGMGKDSAKEVFDSMQFVT